MSGPVDGRCSGWPTFSKNTNTNLRSFYTGTPHADTRKIAYSAPAYESLIGSVSAFGFDAGWRNGSVLIASSPWELLTRQRSTTAGGKAPGFLSFTTKVCMPGIVSQSGGRCTCRWLGAVANPLTPHEFGTSVLDGLLCSIIASITCRPGPVAERRPAPPGRSQPQGRSPAPSASPAPPPAAAAHPPSWHLVPPSLLRLRASPG